MKEQRVKYCLSVLIVECVLALHELMHRYQCGLMSLFPFLLRIAQPDKDNISRYVNDSTSA